MVKYDIIKINNKNVRMVPQGITNMKFSQELDKAVARIKERIEREVPDTGYFRNFAEDFANSDEKLCAKAGAKGARDSRYLPRLHHKAG